MTEAQRDDWEKAQADAYQAFLEKHNLDVEYALIDMTDEQLAELEAIEARIDAEYGYDPVTMTFQ